MAEARAGVMRCPIMPASNRRCASIIRNASSGRKGSSSPRRSPSAWGSTSRMSASSPISTCRRTSKPITRRLGRAGRDGLPADAWMTYGMADVMSLFRLLETGEATDRQRRIERQKIEALIGYCETVSCRRQVLLGYFGEADHPPCGNCDNCQTPVPSWDGTIAAQKALSAIYRTGQRFGAHHLVDVLLGAETERVQRLGHNRLKTFGVGTELDRRGWLSVYRQLVAQGVVLPDVAGHGGLSLAPGSAEILRGSRSVRFRVEGSGRERRSGSDRSQVGDRCSGARSGGALAVGSTTRLAPRRGTAAGASALRDLSRFYSDGSGAAPPRFAGGIGRDSGRGPQQARTLWRCRHRRGRREHDRHTRRHHGWRTRSDRLARRALGRAKRCCIPV